MKFCIYCGKEIRDAATFCPYCGKQMVTQAKEDGEESNKSSERDFWEDVGQKVLSQAKELGKNVVEIGKSMGQTVSKAYQEEMQSDAKNEYRIVDSRVLRLIVIIMIMCPIICVFFLRDILREISHAMNNPFYLIHFFVVLIIMFYFWISLVNVRMTYLSDYLPIFCLNIWLDIVILKFGLVLMESQVISKLTAIIFVTYIPSSVAIIVLFQTMIKQKKGHKALFYIITVRTILDSLVTAGVLINLVKKKEVLRNYGEVLRNYGYSKGLWGSILNPNVINFCYLLCFYLVIQIIYDVCGLLFVLCLSNHPEKKYVSRKEPGGKHIKHRSISFSVVLSILTLGIYYFAVWTYTIISDIRKVEGKKGLGAGEWLLYHCVPFYKWYWLYSRSQKVSVVCRNNRIQSSGSGGLFIFLSIVGAGIINMALLQNTLNDLADVMDEHFTYGTIIQQDSYYNNAMETATTQENYMEKLKELYELKKEGIISEGEFEEKKKEFLGRM